MTGKFIVLEGIDGSGLTTQARLLAEAFARTDPPVKVHVTKEPSDGPIGVQVRQVLSGRVTVPPHALALMFAADRLDHLEHAVLPRLADGVHVICDRYYLSSLAYQALHAEMGWVAGINAHCRVPDLTIFLKVPVGESVRRISAGRFGRELFEADDTLVRVRSHYLRLLTGLVAFGEQVVSIDGARSRADVFDDVRRAVMSALQAPAAPARALAELGRFWSQAEGA